MASIYLETFVAAPPPVVFDLSRSVDVHQSSMQHHKEKAVGGLQTGLMNLGDTFTWQARHLFKIRHLKVKITQLQSPLFFIDEMVQGDFKMMRHRHAFEPAENGTLMKDQFSFASPFGIIGKLFDTLFLKQYMTRLLTQRNQEIKRLAEASALNQHSATAGLTS